MLGSDSGCRGGVYVGVHQAQPRVGQVASADYCTACRDQACACAGGRWMVLAQSQMRAARCARVSV
eukprot:743615-Prymnesium_polylepis.1